MARYMGKSDIRIVSFPAMPIAAADAGSLDVDHHSVRRGSGVRRGGDLYGFLELVEESCFHEEKSRANLTEGLEGKGLLRITARSFLLALADHFFESGRMS